MNNFVLYDAKVLWSITIVLIVIGLSITMLSYVWRNRVYIIKISKDAPWWASMAVLMMLPNAALLGAMICAYIGMRQGLYPHQGEYLLMLGSILFVGLVLIYSFIYQPKKNHLQNEGG